MLVMRTAGIRSGEVGVVGAAGRRGAADATGVVLHQNDAALQRITGVLVRPVA